MEVVLEFNLSMKRVNVEWKQIISAVFLAAVLFGIYVLVLYQSEKYFATSVKEGITAENRKKAETIEVDGLENEMDILKTKAWNSLEKRRLASYKSIDTDAEKLTDGTNEVNGITPDEMKISSEGTVLESKARTENEEVAGQIEPESAGKALHVIFHGNGGFPEVSEASFGGEEFSADSYDVPEKPGKLFDGWYEDEACTVPFEELRQGQEKLELYAGWKDYPGFLTDERGYVIGYSDASLIVTDGVISLPLYRTCTGIGKTAFEGLEEELFEVYVPANITSIENGAFDTLYNLIYIEVATDNPSYYSKDGILYSRDGSLTVIPMGRLE